MKYAFMIRPYVICIKNGLRKIDDVRPDELKQAVIEALASEGLGPDAKPLPKEQPKEEEEPKKPVEDKKEDEPNKDTKEDEKSPVEEDKGDK